MALFICTAGTSIAGGPLRPSEAENEYRERMETRLQDLRNRYPETFLKRASAESHALICANVYAKDEVVFLVSETADGRLTGNRLVTLIQKEVGCRVRMVEIKGLQIHDGQAFRRIGINGLFDTIDRLTKDWSLDEIHLNATGGYKGIIPYIVIYGMFRGISVSYIYEFSDTLITLPALPVEFDWERLMPAHEVILTLFHEGAIDEERWRKLLPLDYVANQDRYDTLFEFDDGLVTLSVIGLLMKGRLDASEAEAVVYLSPQARKVLKTAGAEIRSHLDSIIERVRNPLHRAGFKHAESLHKTDMKVWKVYGSSGPRMLYWTDAGHVYVGELFAHHDEYEAYLSGTPPMRKDYDLKTFIRAERVERQDYQTVLSQLRQLNDEPAQRARALEEEIRALRIELNQARRERNTIRRSTQEQAQTAAERAAKKAKTETQSSLDKAYGAKLRAKDSEIDKLEVLIEALRSDILRLQTQVFEGSTSASPTNPTAI